MIWKSNAWCAMGMAAGVLLIGLSPTQAGVISAGHNDSFGLQADGSLWAWGYNGDLIDIVSNYTTNDFCLVQEANQLGLAIPRGVYYDCDTGYSTSTPARVGTAANWVGIYASPGAPYDLRYLAFYDVEDAYHTFGIQKDGSLWAWGYDGYPSEVTTPQTPSTLYIGKGALGLGNRVVAETYTYTNSDFETNTVTEYFAASVGVPTRIGTDSDWLTVAPGSAHALALKNNGTLWSWGYDGMGEFLEVVNAGTNRWHGYAKGTLGLGVDLLVSTWALTNHIGSEEEDVYNEYVAGVMTPTQIGTGTHWVAAAAGYDHSLAIKADGSLYAWGANTWEHYVYALTNATDYGVIYTNFSGVLGLGNMALLSTNTPTRVGVDTDWSKVAAGASISFAIKKNGSLWAWGDNGYVWNDFVTPHNHTTDYAYAYGRLGLGTNVLRTNLPTRVGTDNDWVDIAVSMSDQTVMEEVGISFIVADANQQCLALKSDGSLWAWGYSWFDYDLFYNYTIVAHVQAVPIRVGKDNDWIAIASGVDHSLALKADGSLWAWGDNVRGQLGNTSGSWREPVQVGSLFTWGYADPIPAYDAGGADYDGDGMTDFVIYDAANALLSVRLSTRGYDQLTFNFTIGGPGYRLVTADFDGDRLADPAAYQDSTGTWQIALSRYDYNILTFPGLVDSSGCAPAAADYDGDGLADPTIYKDGTAVWRIRSSANSYVTVIETLGGAGSIAASADYNRDGKAEVAAYQPATGIWKVLFGYSVVTIPSFGGLTYVPAVADYDGDGNADPAIYEPSTGRLRIKLSLYHYWEYDSAAYGVFLGGGGRCIPVSADYDGDGIDDPAIYNYVTRKWTVMLSTYGWYAWTSPW